MHVIQRVPRRMQRRMHLPSERMVVNGVGLGEVDGLFNIGKMFTRITKITPSSFKLKNIAGALGSATAFTLTGGLSSLAPKLTGAHSSAMKGLGYGVAAVGAVAGGVALLPAGALTGAGSMLSSIGGSILKGGTSIMSIFSGGGVGIPPQQQQQSGMTQAEYDTQQAYNAQQQAAYDAQVQAQQNQMYIPAGYNTSGSGAYAQPASMNTSYGDLRSPYTAISEDGSQIQVDPRTGQVMQSGMLPDLSMTTWLVIGGATLVGWYFMSGSKNTN